MTHASEKKILIVDDEPDVRNFLAACIKDVGFQVETAVDGEDALAKVRANPPDLMTLDMVMPRKSGIQVIRTLRQNERFKRLPVIVITAHAKDEFGSDDVKDFYAFTSGLRPRYVMEKPVTPEKLAKSIIEILDVEAEEAPPAVSSELQELMQMIQQTDEDTLKKITDMLNK
ncbi:MAG: response regulator [Thermodesulfobacteriota bacterium]|nr:response regulator [Thermodesulfobacteriota bacterium]